MRETGSCSGGQGLLSKALIRLSADEWACTPSLVVQPEVTQPCGLWALQQGYCQRLYTKRDLPVPPSLWGAPADPHLHSRPSNTIRQFWFSLLWAHCSSPLGLSVHKILFVPSKTGVCFPQTSRSPVIKSCWPSRPDSLGIPRVFVEYLGWEA